MLLVQSQKTGNNSEIPPHRLIAAGLIYQNDTKLLTPNRALEEWIKEGFSRSCLKHTHCSDVSNGASADRQEISFVGDAPRRMGPAAICPSQPVSRLSAIGQSRSFTCEIPIQAAGRRRAVD